MSIAYCEFCGQYVDTDYDDEHYLDSGECLEEKVDEFKKEELTEEQIDEELDKL